MQENIQSPKTYLNVTNQKWLCGFNNQLPIAHNNPTKFE